MTIEFDSNMHPQIGENNPLDYQIQLSTGNIVLTVHNATSSSIELLTVEGDSVAYKQTNSGNTQLSISLHKADAITLSALSRLDLTGDFLLEVTKTMHSVEEKKRYLVDVRR